MQPTNNNGKAANGSDGAPRLYTAIDFLNSRWISDEDMKKYFSDCCANTIANLRSDGLPSVLINRQHAYDVLDVDAFMESRKSGGVTSANGYQGNLVAYNLLQLVQTLLEQLRRMQQ